ncbi:MAG: anaerobic carbon-monoxide dehydrogenase catalytic subunit [Desulfitobacteriaceae bacterium]
MRQVRRKTIAPYAREFLLKARQEGIHLSWNSYEQMLPQDGFGILGLTCHDCLQGPCRLNPFRTEERRTVCGLTRDDLVFRGIRRLMNTNSGLPQSAWALMTEIRDRAARGTIDTNLTRNIAKRWGINGEKTGELLEGFAWRLLDLLAGRNTPGAKIPSQVDTGDRSEATATVSPEDKDFGLSTLLAEAGRKMALMALSNDLQEILRGSTGRVNRRFGLNSLNEKGVNICLEGLSPRAWDRMAELIREMHGEAVSRGAEAGFNLISVGDLPDYYDFPALDRGTAEFAVLTGLVDAYGYEENGLVGAAGSVAANYHTAVVSFSGAASENELREFLRQAAVAYGGRDASKIKGVQAGETGESGYKFDPAVVSQGLEKGTIQGLCLLGGGFNVKVTGDEALVSLAENLASWDVLCLTYGNTGAALGKYGFLGPDVYSGSVKVAQTLGYQKAPAVYCLGGESQAATIFQLVRQLSGQKMVAVFPALSGGNDLQAAMALVQAGVKVLTGVPLPVEGSAGLAGALAGLFEVCEPKELLTKLEKLLTP